jgi:hypothetical protein
MHYWWCPSHRWYVCRHCQKQIPDKPTSKQVRQWHYGECTALDKLVFKVIHDFNLPDPNTRYSIKMNWYPDGMAQVTDHRHDNWTILVSLGAPRVLNVDYARVFMEDGDVILFGTQKHGVPVAAPSQGGRLSLVFMFAPDQQVEAASLRLSGYPVCGKPKPKVQTYEECAEICNDECHSGLSMDDLQSLCSLGFTMPDAKEALVVCKGDGTAAANLLLNMS